ncbi:MAG TPA: DUF6807 family protein, partial [Anseongella sp.]|nr:DUF6807 family protein [Anseongella sp.]
MIAILVYAGACVREGKSGQQESRAENTSDTLPEVAFRQEPGKLFITIGGQPFAVYVYEDSVITRPYFAHVKTSCGIQATRNHPPQAGDPQDHGTYHPGIWQSFGDLNGNDYWRLKSKVEHEMFTEQPKGGRGEGSFTVRNFYMGGGGKDRMIAELVKYTVLVRPSGYLLVQNSTFSSDAGDFTFGDQEEMGFGIRVNTGITAQFGQGSLSNADGLKGEDATWGQASKWIDYSGTVEGNYLGVVLMPDPGNFRPSWYHARDYGMVTANPFGRAAMEQGEKSAVTVKMGEEFNLGFGVLLYCNPDGRQID